MILLTEGHIEKIRSMQRPTLVGISGFGGAGKTTWANEMGSKLAAPVISVDEFMKDKNRTDYKAWESMDFNRLEKEVVLPFMRGENPIVYGHYDWGANRVAKDVSVEHDGILIIEGVGLFRPTLNKYFSYKIWIACNPDEAARRGKKRDREVHKNPQDDRWDGDWQRMDKEYQDDYRPDKAADAIVLNYETV